MKALMVALLLAAFPGVALAQEICNNGIDDDGDGLIDLNDPDCPCNTLVSAENLPSYIRNHSFEERGCCPLGFVGPFGPPYLDCATGWHQATVATSDYFHECGYSPAGLNLPPPDGDGAIGFFAMHGWMEYVGTCLTYPLPSNPLIAGTTYTLSMWISGVSVDDVHAQTVEQAQAYGTLFPDPLPLALFGYANACVPFPVQTTDCIGDMPGWSELGQVLVQPSWDWTRVSITFTPAQDIHSIMIGGGCNLPASFTERPFIDSQGNHTSLMPYFLADELLLTEAGDQVLSPTSVSGNLCAHNVLATAQPPPGATNYQWYLNGVALPGQTGTTLNVSAGNYGPGLYTMAMDFNGQCLMGSAPVAPGAIPVPFPAFAPDSGCAPLTVALADTTGGGTQTILWALGDGTTRTDSAFTHTYNNPGTYDITLRVRNGAGCEGEVTIDDAITVFPGVGAQIGATPNPVDAENPVVQLNGTGTGNIISWWWDIPGADPATSNQQDVAATFPSEPGTYPVMLVVTSPDGCVDTVRSVVNVINPGVIELPNVFSPNGDGHNDRFIPIGYKGAPGLMEIYNRWGQLIFSTHNLAQGWNGNGAPDGTYFYIVTPDEPGSNTLTGHITLVR
ncbi:MAG TPA: PKD domain-containing protein [Flavobacteriales bacterium]|nr:PKD domain-containing protein [Flavobacteriales bacterium]